MRKLKAFDVKLSELKQFSLSPLVLFTTPVNVAGRLPSTPNPPVRFVFIRFLSALLSQFCKQTDPRSSIYICMLTIWSVFSNH